MLPSGIWTCNFLYTRHWINHWTTDVHHVPLRWWYTSAIMFSITCLDARTISWPSSTWSTQCSLSRLDFSPFLLRFALLDFLDFASIYPCCGAIEIVISCVKTYCGWSEGTFELITWKHYAWIEFVWTGELGVLNNWLFDFDIF